VKELISDMEAIQSMQVSWLRPLLTPQPNLPHTHAKIIPSRKLLWVMMGMAFASPALAQEAELPEVRVFGTAEETLKQQTGVSIISAEDLANRPPANDLSEILATQPGVSLSGASSVGAYGNQREIDLRGMGAENTMILIDGKPVQSRQGAITRRTGDRDTGGDTNWVPVDQIERIEIIRGPAAARYGSGSSGGVINIITQPPADTFAGSATVYFSKPEDEMEGIGTRRLGFSLSGPLAENFSFRLYGSAANTYGDKPGINGVLDDGSPNWVAGKEGRRNRDINALLRWDLTPDQVLEFETGVSRQGNMYAGDTSNMTPALGNSAEIVGGWANRGAETRRVYRRTAGITHRGKWGDLGDSRIVFQYENTHTINCRQGSSGKGEGNCGSNGADDTQTSKMENFYLKGELNTPFTLGGLVQVLTTGAEFRSQRLRDNNALMSTTTPPQYAEMKSNTNAFFVEDNIAISDAFILTPGVRLDHHSDFGYNWSPSLNALYELGGGLTLKGGIARTFKAPTPYQTSPNYASGLGGSCPYNGLGLPADSYNCTVRGNPDLEPEISVNKEIGMAWNNQRGWDASLAYFQNDYKNRIVSEALSDVTDITNPIDFKWENSGKVLVKGYEGSLNLPLWGPNGKRLKLLNNLTWMLKNHNKETHQPISIMPHYTLNSTLQWRPVDPVQVQFTGTLYGSRKPRSVSYHGYPMIGAARRERAPYAIFGLNGTYEFDKHNRFGFGVTNLFDRQIKRAERLAAGSVSSGNLDDRVISTGAGAHTYNEPGRAFYVTYTASF
jgi:ferric enterobactin receptor